MDERFDQLADGFHPACRGDFATLGETARSINHLELPITTIRER